MDLAFSSNRNENLTETEVDETGFGEATGGLSGTFSHAPTLEQQNMPQINSYNQSRDRKVKML
jgi:hypothetical protein